MCTGGEPGVFFSRDHNICGTGPKFSEQKGSFQSTMHSTFGVYDICLVIARYV